LSKGYRLAGPAKADLDEIWLYFAGEAGAEIADRIIDGITSRFSIIAAMPGAGRISDRILPGIRVFPVEKYLIYYGISADGQVYIARVIHGMRDQEKAWMMEPKREI
jgi:toxin ParE1/3/4